MHDNNWTSAELTSLRETSDVHIAPLRADGTTYGTPTRIWAVVVEDEVYVRPASGPTSSWYAAAIAQGAGQITVAGTTFDVTFEAGDTATYDAIDAAYAQKYDTDPTSVSVMVGPGPRSSTVKVTCR